MHKAWNCHYLCQNWRTFVDPKVVIGPGCHSDHSIVGTCGDSNAELISESFRG